MAAPPAWPPDRGAESLRTGPRFSRAVPHRPASGPIDSGSHHGRDPQNAYPSNRLEQIQWGEARADDIADNFEALGVRSAEAGAFQLTVQQCGAEQAAYAKAQAAARDAGDAVRAKAKTMGRQAQAIIANVRAKAHLSTNPSAVYGLASIAPRQAPTPAGPPAQPTNVTCTLNTDGTNTVFWASSVSQTIFAIERQLLMNDGTTVPYTRLAGPTDRPFVDATVPAGTSLALYRVRAHRGGQSSPWSEPGALQLVSQTATTQSNLRLAA